MFTLDKCLPIKIKRCKKCDRCHIVGDGCKTCASNRKTLWNYIKLRRTKGSEMTHEELKAQWNQYRQDNLQAVREKEKNWRANNKDKDRARKREYERNLPWESKIARRCNDRARIKNIPRGMKPRDLYTATTGKLPEFCPIFPHIKLDYQHNTDMRCWPTVDRIVPELGYVSDNVWVISWAANTWKSNGSNPEERKRITALMAPKPKKQQINPNQQSLF